MWDPDEIMTLELKVVPQVKQGTSALVVVNTPKAARDQTSIATIKPLNVNDAGRFG